MTAHQAPRAPSQDSLLIDEFLPLSPVVSANAGGARERAYAGERCRTYVSLALGVPLRYRHWACGVPHATYGAFVGNGEDDLIIWLRHGGLRIDAEALAPYLLCGDPRDTPRIRRVLVLKDVYESAVALRGRRLNEQGRRR